MDLLDSLTNWAEMNTPKRKWRWLAKGQLWPQMGGLGKWH